MKRKKNLTIAPELQSLIGVMNKYSPEQMKAIEEYSMHIQDLLERFEYIDAENLLEANETLNEVRNYAEDYWPSIALFDCISLMCKYELDRYISKLSNKYPECNKIGKDGQVILYIDEAEKKYKKEFNKM